MIKLNDDAKTMVASILTLSVVIGKKSESKESEVVEVFKRMFLEMEKIGKGPSELKYNF